MAGGNAGNNVAISSASDVTIFRPVGAGGTQRDGITSISMRNDGACDLLINADGFADEGEYYPLKPGEAITFSVDTKYASTAQILWITAKAVGAGGALSWAATGRR